MSVRVGRAAVRMLPRYFCIRHFAANHLMVFLRCSVVEFLKADTQVLASYSLGKKEVGRSVF